MASGSISIEGNSILEKEYSFKRLRCISQEYVAYVEIKMVAKVIDEKLDECNYDHQHITKAAVYLPLFQGEIKLTNSQSTLGIDFDFIQTESGYRLELQWATFNDHNGYKIYYSIQPVTVSIPFGSSTIKSLNIDYLMYPIHHEYQGIAVKIIEANINIMSSSQTEVKLCIIKDQSLKKDFDKIFDDQKTINIDLMSEMPNFHLLEKAKTLRI